MHSNTHLAEVLLEFVHTFLLRHISAEMLSHFFHTSLVHAGTVTLSIVERDWGAGRQGKQADKDQNFHLAVEVEQKKLLKKETVNCTNNEQRVWKRGEGLL